MEHIEPILTVLVDSYGFEASAQCTSARCVVSFEDFHVNEQLFNIVTRLRLVDSSDDVTVYASFAIEAKADMQSKIDLRDKDFAIFLLHTAKLSICHIEYLYGEYTHPNTKAPWPLIDTPITSAALYKSLYNANPKIYPLQFDESGAIKIN
ncbi:MAG: hypothetical protein EOP56_18040 [Sphingobacteriales bacterium]|nr:MAG: hypothetical protein EOP56_18040 [Sphingobacteriales bacterium]